MAGKTKRRSSTANRFGMATIAVVVIILIAVLSVQSGKLHTKIETYAAENEELQEAIDRENGRKEELKSLPEYVQSDEYIEKVAREKFGLVYPNETIFKAED